MYKILFIIAFVCFSANGLSAEPSNGILCCGNARTGYINQSGPVSQPSGRVLQDSRGGFPLLENGRLITGITGLGMICISTQDNELFWNLQHIFGPCSISDGIIYAQYRNPEIHVDTSIIGISIENGEIVWRWNLREVRSFIVENNVLYTVFESNNHQVKVFAIHTQDSIPIWELELPQFAANSISLLDNTLIVALQSGGMRYHSEGLTAISAVTGELLWTIEKDSIANNNFPLAGNAVLIRSPEGLQAISISNGSVLWTSSDALLCDPSIRENSIYYISGSDIVEASLSTGERITSQKIPNCSHYRRFSITLAENAIFLLSADYLLSLDYELKPNWLYSLPSCDKIIIDDGKAYCSTSNGLLCLTEPE